MKFLKLTHCALVIVACTMQGDVEYAQNQPLWTHAFDFDGDDEKDSVEVEYTGGAHCCYRLTVHLTSTHQRHRLPFLLDGGYVGGLDLSQPKRFTIQKNEAELPEMLMEIATYNGVAQPLPGAWKERYDIHTHHIAVGFAQGRLSVRDWQWSR
jgi:hypothetical protein